MAKISSEFWVLSFKLKNLLHEHEHELELAHAHKKLTNK